MFVHPVTKTFTEIPPEVAVVIVGALFAALAMYFVWRLGILDAPKPERCWMCLRPTCQGANFCHHCGVHLYRCRHCGRLHHPTANYCPKFGKYIGPP